MTSTHLVCRRSGKRVFIPAAAVLSVRELPLQPAPPLAPEWVRGLALLEDAAVLVVRVGKDGDSGTELAAERVVLLLQQENAEPLQLGILVDEVIGLDTTELPPPVDAAAWCSALRGDEAALRIDPCALQTALSAAPTPGVHA